MLARVVDFPLPVAPVISIKPFLLLVKFITALGSPNESIGGISNGNLLYAAAQLPLWIKTFTLNILTPGTEIEKSISLPDFNFSLTKTDFESTYVHFATCRKLF